MTAQTAYIARHLSLYSSANNHLMAELSALTVIGDALGRPRWCRRAARLLDRYVGSQIHPNGVGAEQSPAYLAHAMEFVLAPGRVLDERDAPLAARTRERLQPPARLTWNRYWTNGTRRRRSATAIPAGCSSSARTPPVARRSK